MNYYLVDLENIGFDNLIKIENIKKCDKMIIFYSNRCKSITLDVVDEILKNKIDITLQKIRGKTQNALDFQLSSYLGYLIRKEKALSQLNVEK